MITDASSATARVLPRLLAGATLDRDEAAAVLGELVGGQLPDALVAALLTAYAMRPPTGQEVTGFAAAMATAARPLPVTGPLLDTCGTGGDNAGTFNVSTTAALVCAAAGVRVAKHGNRAATSKVGSADLLEGWGITLELPPEAAAAVLEEVGITFLYARTYHPAMAHVAPVRAQLPMRTLFNVLGPLSNPARPSHQVLGVADATAAPVMADALAALGTTALVFRGDDGLDELTTTGPSTLWHVADGQVRTDRLDPTELGIAPAGLDELRGGDLARNRAISEAVLTGRPGPHADIVALNAAAGLWTAGVADDLAGGLDHARQLLATGAGMDVLRAWAAATRAA